jgi:hypothetical protein
MTFADYSAMCDGVELDKQKRLLIQRHFIAAILNTQITKRISPQDVIFLSIFDQTKDEQAKEMMERLLAKELKRKKHGRSETTGTGGNG